MLLMKELKAEVVPRKSQELVLEILKTLSDRLPRFRKYYDLV